MTHLSQFTVRATLVLAFVALLGCGMQPVQSRVVGSYLAEHSNGEERLELRADGTYLHRYKKAQQQPGSQTIDHWEFKPRWFARPIVVLHNFTPHFPRHEGSTKDWELEVEEDFGMIRLYVDPKPPRDIFLGAPGASYEQ